MQRFASRPPFAFRVLLCTRMSDVTALRASGTRVWRPKQQHDDDVRIYNGQRGF